MIFILIDIGIGRVMYYWCTPNCIFIEAFTSVYLHKYIFIFKAQAKVTHKAENSEAPALSARNIMQDNKLCYGLKWSFKIKLNNFLIFLLFLIPNLTHTFKLYGLPSITLFFKKKHTHIHICRGGREKRTWIPLITKRRANSKKRLSIKLILYSGWKKSACCYWKKTKSRSK